MTGSSRRRAKWRRSPAHVRRAPERRLLPGSSPDLLAVQVPFAMDEGSRLPGALEVAGGGDREVRGEHRGIEASVVLDAGLARLAHHCSIGVEGAQNLGAGQQGKRTDWALHGHEPLARRGRPVQTHATELLVLSVAAATTGTVTSALAGWRLGVSPRATTTAAAHRAAATPHSS